MLKSAVCSSYFNGISQLESMRGNLTIKTGMSSVKYAQILDFLFQKVSWSFPEKWFPRYQITSLKIFGHIYGLSVWILTFVLQVRHIGKWLNSFSELIFKAIWTNGMALSSTGEFSVEMSRTWKGSERSLCQKQKKHDCRCQNQRGARIHRTLMTRSSHSAI